jgi:hypothetical protein
MFNIQKTTFMKRKLMCAAAFVVLAGAAFSQALPTHIESLRTMPGGADLKPMSTYRQPGNDDPSIPVLKLNEQQRESIAGPEDGMMVYDPGQGFLFYSSATSTWEGIQDRYTSPDALLQVSHPDAVVEHMHRKKRQEKKMNAGSAMEKGWQKFALRTKKLFHIRKCKTCPDW